MVMKIPKIIKSADVVITNQLREITGVFDYELQDSLRFETPELELPDEWGVGLIVGPSGSGKTTLLSHFGGAVSFEWDSCKSVFDHFKGSDDAINKLTSAGLNTIPQWSLPYRLLSEGQKARADLARGLSSNSVFDEFTSSVNRSVAKSMSSSLRRSVDRNSLSNVVVATCHSDVEDWLQPDWVIDTNEWRVRPRRLERRPEIKLEVLPCSREVWSFFRNHHYLSGNLNKSSRCWIAVWGGELVGFASTLAFPNGNFSNAWREHRTVVLPDYQGLGLGVRLSDAIAKMVVLSKGRYFSKTAHPRMISYRESSPDWKGTSKNMKARPDYAATRDTKEDGHKMLHSARVCGSHEYIGGSL